MTATIRPAFSLISVNTIIAFVIGLGWTGRRRCAPAAGSISPPSPAAWSAPRCCSANGS